MSFCLLAFHGLKYTNIYEFVGANVSET